MRNEIRKYTIQENYDKKYVVICEVKYKSWFFFEGKFNYTIGKESFDTIEEAKEAVKKFEHINKIVWQSEEVKA